MSTELTGADADEPNTATPRTSEAGGRWEQILDAATNVFCFKGYEGTTIRDIAREVEMLPGSLYYYIDSKEDLLFKIISDFHDFGRSEVEKVTGVTDDPCAELRAIIQRHVEVNAENTLRTAVFYNEFRHLSDDRKRTIIESRHRHEDYVESLIVACQEEGTIRSPLSPRMTAVAILAGLNSVHHWYRPDQGVDPATVGRFYADLILEGLGCTSRERADDN